MTSVTDGRDALIRFPIGQITQFTNCARCPGDGHSLKGAVVSAGGWTADIVLDGNRIVSIHLRLTDPPPPP